MSEKITYTSAGSSEEFHREFERAAQEAPATFGRLVACSIGGVPSSSGRSREVRSPIDADVLLATVEQASTEETAAMMAWEVGKNRIEAVAEVEESADLLTYYCDRLEAEAGYRRPLSRLSPNESTESVFLPYGAWAVIAPFNFPLALAAGMTAHPVGMTIVRGAAREHPRPVVVEMGGKNPAIVTAAADLDAAAEGVAKSAFGFGGQKCSACSRAYVVESVAEEFVTKLIERAKAIQVGNPLERDVYLGPLIHAKAVATFVRWVELIEQGGGTIVAGGQVLTDGDLARGHYVEPTVALVPDAAHPVWAEELFVPILAVRAVADLDEGLALANRSRYGLTAGIFSHDPAEVSRFLERIEAGVTYVNRRSGATTGAWPGVDPFGGWKGSGACGPAALGPHYLLKFLREQSRTVNDIEL